MLKALITVPLTKIKYLPLVLRTVIPRNSHVCGSANMTTGRIVSLAHIALKVTTDTQY